MAICLSQNFNKEAHSFSLNFKDLQSLNVSDLIEEIYTVLKGKPFSTDINDSENPEKYKDSIKELVGCIGDTLKQESPIKLTLKDIIEIKRGLSLKMLPVPLTKAELAISAVIAGTDLVKQEEIDKMKYNKVILSIYGQSNISIDNWRLRNFEDALGDATVLYINRGIVDNDWDLNNNVIDYQESQYKIMRKYLQEYEFPEIEAAQFPVHYYTKSTIDSNIRVQTSNSLNTFTAMYNIINYLKKKGEFKDLLEKGWNDDMLGLSSKERDFFNAVSAYINLTYFNETLKGSLTSFVSNKRQDMPIEVSIDESGKRTYSYKYSIQVGNSNAIKTWGVEDSDAVKQMSNFIKFLINRIPIYDIENVNDETKEPTKQFARLESKDFLGTIVKLKELGSNITLDKEFASNCSKLISNQSLKNGPLNYIFKTLFGTTKEKNKNVINELKKKGFDINNLNILYSIYHTVFNPKNDNSWLNLENNYRKNGKGFRSRYNLVENIYGAICSTAALNYLNTTYNSETEEYETTVKEKYSINRTKFDIKNSINTITQDREDRGKLLEMYLIEKLEDNLSYSVKIGNNKFVIKPRSNKNKQVNILSKKKASSSDYDIELLDKFKEIDIKSDSGRKLIINSIGGIEYEFKQLLAFIDTMLDMNYSKSSENLNELSLCMAGDKNFLKDLFISAVRALVVNDTYNKFSKATKSNGEPYAKTELIQYMKDSGEWVGIATADKKGLTEYFDKTDVGYQLNTVYVNEPWITKLSRVRAILAQDTVTSVITDLMGNKNPNMSPTYLNSTGEIKNQIRISNAAAMPTAKLLFSQNQGALLNSTINLDIQTNTFTSKQVKRMSQQELIYDAIINKFLIPLEKTNTIYTQCTTQSDKTKFIATQVDLFTLGLGKSEVNTSSFEGTVLQKYINTIGEAYKGVYKNILNDYRKVFPELDTIEKINDALQGRIAVLVDGIPTTINNEKTLIKAVNNYNKNNPDDTVIFYKDLTYRAVEGGLAFNELLYDYANNLYRDTNTLAERMKLEKIRFLNNLTNNHVIIEMTPQLKSILSRLFNTNFANNWIIRSGKNKEYLVLAKQGGKNILYGQISEDSNITLNPLLNAYFLIDNLVGNNLRFASTGSEVNHKIKALKKLNLRNKLNTLFGDSDVLKMLLQTLHSSENITFFDLNTIREKARIMISTNPEYQELYNIVNRLYKDLIYAMENLGQNALFKRNVIMSATMTKMVPSLEGITDTMKIACIDDIGAKVFNFSGKHEDVDAHDGSALVNGLWSILENKSLGSNEVGNIKKPIHHSYDDKYMTATLLKYATDAITNNWMRQSVGNDLNDIKHGIDLHHVFKKMSHVRWSDGNGNWKDGEIDLINGCGFRRTGKINFNRDILELDIVPNNELYYNKNGLHIRICGFGYENGVYYTEELAFNLNPTDASGKLTKVYHYFNENGEHYPSTTLLNNPNLHTIDSLFELHTALGGIWSEQWNGSNYEYSEGSMVATVNFINNVCTFKTKEGEDPEITEERKKDVSIANYDQPLKRAMVHMLANNSAVKNGVGNINPSTSWYDDSDFSYITISTNNYGIQQDSDHTADEAHMTEFSQVISSLDAGGQLHDYVSQIYEQLGQTALDLAEVELNATEEFRETEDKSVLYDVLGRTIMANLRNGNGSIGLAEAIISNIKKRFNLNTDHGLDSLKIPFSDPNIYSLIISTFVSNLNKKSIKRKYPGLGTVMAPSYNMSMIFDINVNGKYCLYQFTDLIKLAKDKNFTSNELDNTKANRDIVKQYLESELEKIAKETNVSSFLPTENILCTFDNITNTGDRLQEKAHISFKGALDYYAFQADPKAYLSKLGYTIHPDTPITYQKDITVPRNLAPARIEFDYEIKTGIDTSILMHTNVFNSWRVKKQAIGLEELEKRRKDKEITDEDYKILSNKLISECNVDSVFINLKKGLFELEDGSLVEISNLKNEPAEIIMSNLYATKFGIKSGDSLAYVLEKGEKYFNVPELTVMSDTYDMAYTRGDGDHLFLTFKPLKSNTDTFKSKSQDWDNINKVSYNSEYEIALDSPKVVNRIYATTADNVRLFEVGREIINESVVWDNDLNCFVRNGKKVDNLKNFRRRGNDVIEYIEFISKHEVTETFEKGTKKTYTLYNINRSNIARCLEYKKNRSLKELTRYKKGEDGNKISYILDETAIRNEEVNDFIAKLLKDIYCTDSFAGIDLNSTVSSGSRAVLNNTLKKFANKIDFDPALKDYIDKLSAKVHNASFNKEEKTYNIDSNSIRKMYYTKMRKKQFISFKKSLEFTVARIPAQTLQSFMKMKNVGFTGTKTGQCYVTAWQTWLQGSDYKQNCSL